MKKIIVISMLLLFLMPMADVSAADDVEIRIKGGYGKFIITMINNKDAPITLYIRVTLGMGIDINTEYNLPAHSGVDGVFYTTGLGIITVKVTTEGKTVSRLGFALGNLIFFVTPPFF